MGFITSHPLIKSLYDFIQGHPTLWFFLLLGVLGFLALNLLTGLIPQLDIIKSKIIFPTLKYYKNKKLIKSAIKSDIRGHINKEIAKMRDYLPQGWAEKMDVDWVEVEEPFTLRDDNKVVIRIRPVENQDRNFVNAAYHYLRSSFFPKTHLVIPKQHFEASVLYVCRKIVEGRGDSAKEIFEDHVMDPVIQRHAQIPNHLDAYKNLDKRGFFTGTFLRELHLMAIGARFGADRNNMNQETAVVIKHMQDFINLYDSHRTGAEEMPSSAWYHDGPISKYNILLVAHPSKTKGGVDAYINRAKNGFNAGTKRLYVFGASNESRFADAVIAGIEGVIEGVRLIERFKTPFDYRGDRYGVGAVFELTTKDFI